MAQDFKINNITINNAFADWSEDEATQYLNGLTPRERWARHTWQVNVLSQAQYDTLYALQGQKVSLTTTNFHNRNGDYKQYFGVEFEAIRSDHNGPVRENVQLDFQVKL